MTRSWQSAKELVNPHATRRLWPMTTRGMPGIVTPVDSKSSPARTWAAYQTDGSEGARWGSLQRIGRPVALRSADNTPELLAPPAEGIQRAASANMPVKFSRATPDPAACAVSLRIVGLAS